MDNATARLIGLEATAPAMRTLAVTASLLLLALAGCSDNESGTSTTTTETPLPELKEGKGGILGLLANDVFRPVPGALVLLQGTGLTATTDANGQFTLVDLDPGTYIVIASAEGHEWAPQNVDVVSGQYTEFEGLGRRLFNQEGQIVWTQYSVFVPCSVSIVESTRTLDCTGDQSGDSYRSGFIADYTGYADATYLVTEMKANHKASPSQGAFKVVVREEGNGDYWASKFTVDGDYLRLQMKLGNVSLDDTENRNVAWENDKKLETYLFPQGGFKTETQGVLDAQCSSSGVCFESRGLGPQTGVKANFVQSLFLGEPEVDVDSYCVLGEC